MLSFAAIVATLSLQAKPVEYIVSINDSISGTYSFQDLGSKVESIFDAKIGGSTIQNLLIINYDRQEAQQFKYVLTTKTGEKVTTFAQLDWKDGKVQVRQEKEGKANELPIKITSPVWANYHPALFGRVLRSLDSKNSKPQKVVGSMIDQLAPLDLTITFGPFSEKTVNGKRVKVGIHEIRNSFSAQLAATEDGTIIGMNVPSQKFLIVQKGAEEIFADPLAKYPELSQPKFGVKILEKVEIPLRDGTVTKATIVTPDKPGMYPTILTRTPYGRETALAQAAMFAKRGYVFVAQDVRGTGESQGSYDPFMTEQKDGFDSIDWIAKQPWSDQKVGMIGGSYGGLVQWSAASLKPQALKCIVPQVSPPASAMWNLPYENGTFLLLGSLWWLRIVDGPKGTDLSSIQAPLKMSGINSLPLSEADNKVLGFNSKTFDSWLARDRASKWNGWNFENLMKEIKIPALHISGWFDGDSVGTQRNYELLTKAGNKNQWLIYGPWPHAFNTSTKMGDLDFGSESMLELDSVYLRWFDTWLKDKAVGLDKVAKVKFFSMGNNRWNESSAWPPSGSKVVQWNFDFKKKQLLPSKIGSTSATYTYDPKKDLFKAPDVTISTGGESLFTKPISDKGESITLKSPVLTEPVTVAGPLEVEFSFRSSAKDTDFYVSFFDEDEKGGWMYFVAGAKQRASYLSGNDSPKTITPGKTYRVKIRSWDTSHQLRKGHRLVARITSSRFPEYARNLGTGESTSTGTKMVKQSNTIISSRKLPSLVRFHAIASK